MVRFDLLTKRSIGLGGFNGPGPIENVTPDEEAHALLTYAADRGVTFWDTSIIYGESEEPIL